MPVELNLLQLVSSHQTWAISTHQEVFQKPLDLHIAHGLEWISKCKDYVYVCNLASDGCKGKLPPAHNSIYVALLTLETDAPVSTSMAVFTWFTLRLTVIGAFCLWDKVKSSYDSDSCPSPSILWVCWVGHFLPLPLCNSWTQHQHDTSQEQGAQPSICFNNHTMHTMCMRTDEYGWGKPNRNSYNCYLPNTG